MQPATVGAILDAIGKHWPVAPDAEVTLEANPTSVEATRFRGYRAAGVNRVSLGVQALDDDALKALGRTHTAQEALAAVAIARARVRALFVRPDLCAAGTDAAGLGRRAQARASPKPPSICRSISSPSSPTRRSHALHAAGKLAVPDEDTARALYDTTQEVCAAAGLPAYEISNHARPGAECRHNLVYWRAHEYAGIGPGAHGRLDIDGERHATATERRPEAWLMRVESLGHGVVSDDTLLRSQMADEFLLMGLRLAEGIDPARYERLAGRAARSAAHRDPAARKARSRLTPRRQAARDAGGISGARCGGGRSRGVDRAAYVPEPPNERGAGLMICPPVGDTRITARPR